MPFWQFNLWIGLTDIQNAIPRLLLLLKNHTPNISLSCSHHAYGNNFSSTFTLYIFTRQINVLAECLNRFRVAHWVTDIHFWQFYEADIIWENNLDEWSNNQVSDKWYLWGKWHWILWQFLIDRSLLLLCVFYIQNLTWTSQ